MDGNEADISSPWTVRLGKIIFFSILLLSGFFVLKTKALHLDQRTCPPDVSLNQIQAAGPVSGEEQDVSPPVVIETVCTPEPVKTTASLTGMERSATFYYPIIIKASRKHKVDPHLIKAIIATESGFNPRAVSPVGAKGLMQLMPRTARAMGLSDAFNPEKNVDAGVRYFKILLDSFDGDIKLALAAYNAGITRVNAHGGIPPIRQTTLFVKKVSKLHRTFKQQEEFLITES